MNFGSYFLMQDVKREFELAGSVSKPVPDLLYAFSKRKITAGRISTRSFNVSISIPCPPTNGELDYSTTLCIA